MRLATTIEQLPDAMIVRLQGELDHHSAEGLKTQLEEALSTMSRPHMVLSLKNLDFMDSSGLGVILGRYKLIKSRGGQMIVCDVNPAVYRLFEMSGLFKILSIKENESSALSSLGVVS